MGILNVTPDSFSDGGELTSVGDAVDRAARMVEDGADLLDVGGESTRPGAREVPRDREIERVAPVVEALTTRFELPVSVDTRKAAVARAALEHGAAVVNDVSGLAFDPELGGVVARSGAGLVVMHMRGDPGDMTRRARYDDVAGEVVDELRDALARAEEAGIEPERIAVDPGIGFAKTAEHSLEMLARLDALGELGRPVLVGPSRKSFLGHVLGVPPSRRLAGTISACVLAYARGARIFRVHDVGPVVEALAVARVTTGATTGATRRATGRAGDGGRAEREPVTAE